MRDELVARWSEVGDKVVELARAVPEDAYEFRPAAEVRTFADQLRHVAFWNDYARDALRGATPDSSANELPRRQYPDKPSVVEALRKSFDDVRDEIVRRDGTLGAQDVDTVVSSIEHAGEHYGQLAVYARLRGVVPPASRG